jgi:hypothetical protein
MENNARASPFSSQYMVASGFVNKTIIYFYRYV